MTEEGTANRESLQKSKAALTDEQKAYIRAEMKKISEQGGGSQAARIRRRELARETGATIQQISAVSAYKVGRDGLELRPQFPRSTDSSVDAVPPVAQNTHRPVEDVTDSNEISSQKEALYDNPTKRAWRIKIREAIEADFTREELHEARVVCLPGQALQEITEVYLPLGVKPENITCIERDGRVAESMRSLGQTLSLPLTFFQGTVDDFLRGPHEPVTIASFDFLGPLHKNFLVSLINIRTTEKFMLITNFLQKRESVEMQHFLHTNSSAVKTLYEAFGSSRTPLISGKEGVLPEGRHLGLLTTLQQQMSLGRGLRILEALDPREPRDEFHTRLSEATVHLLEILRRDTKKYPALLRKIVEDNLVIGKFIYSLSERLVADVHRYEYTSEQNRSPYQTDILVEYDCIPSVRLECREAHNFILSFIKTLLSHRKEEITIRYEKFGSAIPFTYSGGTTALTLAFCVNGKPHGRITWKKLGELSALISDIEETQTRADVHALDATPRIRITAPTATEHKKSDNEEGR